MKAPSGPRDIFFASLGQRRGNPDLARFPLDLTWARVNADSGSAALSRDYPSPPMSGSPPPPPKGTHASAERSQGRYHVTAAHDVRHGISAVQGSSQQEQPGVIAGRPGQPSYPAETQERMQYAFPNPRPDTILPRALPYPHQSQSQSPGLHHHQPHHPQHQQHQQQHQHSYLPALGPGLAMGSAPPLTYPSLSMASTTASTAISTASRPSAEQREGPIHASPKLQRKTKGHVASACVPCKRAHLRCDTQRPCSRCTSNGKEDACVDVQHKKRGRPRLRDDRESRYDPRFGGYSDTPIMRRPMSLSGYNPGLPSGASFDDSIRRTQSQSYRVLKSQPPEPIAPRFIDRASAADANIFPAPSGPLSIYTKAPEPAAFLTMDLEIAKASSTFLDVLSRPNLKGLRLFDVIVPNDREKLLGHQRYLQDEQRRRDPTYLPPIFGKQEEDRVIQSLGFSPEEIVRYPLDREDLLTFIAQDGQQRAYPVRIGLAKQDSIYFVVIRLWTATKGYAPPTPSPNPRENMSPYYQSMPHHPYSQPTPVSATFDPRQPRMGDSGYGSRQPAQQHSNPSQMMPGLSPGIRTSYAHPSSRPEYSVGQTSYQAPRGELTPTTTTGPPSMQGYHLPPILSHQQPASVQPLEHQPYQASEQPYQPRDDHRRVGIGGLIDRSSPSGRPKS